MPPAPRPDLSHEREVLKEVLAEFAEDAHAGQLAAIAGAARRAFASPKLAPLRNLAREVDDANGGILKRGLTALFARKESSR